MGVKVSIRYLFGFATKFILLLCFAEITLRFLPACEQPYFIFNKTSSILTYDINKQRDGIYTDGNLAQIKAQWHINNMGWNSAYDYATDGLKPVIAVVGNSYVEALQVDASKNLAANLHKILKNNYNCYGFGISGSKLSQYLQMSRYIRDNFHPRIIVLSIMDGDILDSLISSKSLPQNSLFFVSTPSGVSEAPITPYIPSSTKRLMRNLALIRYFTLNKQMFGENSSTINSLSADESLTSDQKNRFNLIANYAFEKIRNENPDTSIFIVIDAPRADIYRGKIQRRHLEAREIIAQTSIKYRFHVVDLTVPMTELYARNHEKFNFENNYHWNEYGHQVVADQIYQKLVLSRVVDPISDPQ